MDNIIKQDDVYELMSWLWIRSDFETDVLADDLDELAEQMAADLKGIGFNKPEGWLGDGRERPQTE